MCALVTGVMPFALPIVPADAALDELLDGTGYVPRRDASGAVIIVKGEQHAQAAPRPAAPPPPPPPPAPAEPETTELQAVQVTGSRIPRAQIEGPSPISVITAESSEEHTSELQSLM